MIFMYCFIIDPSHYKQMKNQHQLSNLHRCPEQPLISELLLYGVLNSENVTMEDITKNEFQVGVLQHYQNGQMVVEEGENEFFEMWAYPDGIKIYDNRLSVINDSQPEQSFGNEHKISLYSSQLVQGHVTEKPNDFIYSFVHTDYGLNRTYFTALCWHEKKYCALDRQKLNIIQNKDIYSKRLPKCTLWQLENDPLMIDFNRQLIYVPKVIIVGSKHSIFTFQREILKFYYRNVLIQTSGLLISEQKYTYFKDLIHLVGYPQAQKFFDSQETTKINHSKSTKYKQLKKDHLKEFYTAFFFLPKFNKNINQIQIMDSWNSSIKFSPMLFNKNVCFYKPNINVSGVIKRIGVDNLIKLWKCVILQRHVLIFSMNNLLLLQLCETILYLIEPIRWENIYIPFLPFHLVNNIDAIQGYLIGMSRIHMDYIIQHYPMNQNVIYDLDENVIIQNGGKNQVNLPPQIYNMICNRLALLGIKKKQKISFSYLFKDYSEPTFQTEQQKIFKIKQVFFDALLYLLNNYRIFAKLNESDLLQFDREGYKGMFKDQNWSEFASELANTMVFIRLCEYHLYQQKTLKWNQYNIGGLFVYCQNILSQKFNNQLWTVPSSQREKIDIPYHEYYNYVLTTDLQKLKQNKQVYLIENYLIKYLNYLQFIKDKNNNIIKEPPSSINTFKQMVIQCLFPWVKQIQQSQNDNSRNNHRNSLRLSLQNLPRLQSLFSQLKNEGLQSLNRRKIQRMLLDYKGKQSNYLNYKQLSKNLSNQQRISV